MKISKFYRRTLYLAYYIKSMDWPLLFKFLREASQQSGKMKIQLVFEMFRDSYQYNISLLEYFYFRFYSLKNEDKKNWAGMGFMYEYMFKMNPLAERYILINKDIFLKEYGEFVKHQFISLKELKNDPGKAELFLRNSSGKVVLKNITGQCGRGIEILPVSELTPETLIQRLEMVGNNLVEEFVIQHPSLNELSSSGLNTLRLITQLNQKQEVEILGARLRITVNSSVDNLAAGNIAAPVDLASGIINGSAVYSDISKNDVTKHPITGKEIVGFQIPYFKESLQLVIDAAKKFPQNRSIGWDVAITMNGPDLIEGNHDWCKLLWQLPVQQGLRPMLEKYLSEFNSIK